MKLKFYLLTINLLILFYGMVYSAPAPYAEGGMTLVGSLPGASPIKAQKAKTGGGIKIADKYGIKAGGVIYKLADTNGRENRIDVIDRDGDSYIIMIELTDWNSDIKLNIYNMLGKEVYQVHNGPPKGRGYQYRIPSGAIQNGVYICVLQGKNFRDAEKFIISR
ncbi:MAG: T9SS type A sorting domain-containing protein [Chloroflexota bacterium]